MMQPIAGGALARPFVTHHNALDMRALPAHRAGAVSEAADRRRPRAGVRDQPQLPERGDLDAAQPRVHDAGVLPGLQRLPATDGDDRGDDRRRSRARRSAPTRSRSASTTISLAPPFRRVSLREGARAAASRAARHATSPTATCGSARRRPRSRAQLGVEIAAGVGRRQDRHGDLRAPVRGATWSSRRSSTTFRPRSRRSRSRSRTIPTRSSGSSCTSAASRWPTPSAS